MPPVTGYNAPVPDMKARKGIKGRLVLGFEEIRGPDDGMVIFGSFRDIEGTHEDSDLDFLVYRHNEAVYTSDEWLSRLGHVIADAIGEYSGMKLDSNILDRAITEDGRFSAAGGILGEVEKGEIYGKEFRDRIKMFDFLIPEENQLSFGLRKVRAEIVRSFSKASNKDEEGLRKSFRSTLTSFSSLHYMLPRLVSIYGGDSGEFMESMTGNDAYRCISELKRDLGEKLGIEKQGFDVIINYMFGVKDFYEACVSELMIRYPDPGRRVISL